MDKTLGKFFGCSSCGNPKLEKKKGYFYCPVCKAKTPDFTGAFK